MQQSLERLLTCDLDSYSKYRYFVNEQSPHEAKKPVMNLHLEFQELETRIDHFIG